MKLVGVDAHGVPLYCPDCSRLLINYNKDGTFNLAAKTSAHGVAEAVIEDYVVIPREVVFIEATCWKRQCRLKRWLRSIDPRRS